MDKLPEQIEGGLRVILGHIKEKAIHLALAQTVIDDRKHHIPAREREKLLSQIRRRHVKHTRHAVHIPLLADILNHMPRLPQRRIPRLSPLHDMPLHKAKVSHIIDQLLTLHGQSHSAPPRAPLASAFIKLDSLHYC